MFESLGNVRTIRGGQSTVHIVGPQGNEVQVIKVVRPCDGLHHLESLRRESDALSVLRHTAIVSLVQPIANTLGCHFLREDFVRGETLKSAIERRGSLPWREALQLVRTLCDPVMHVHSEGFLHRDLKPSNVIVREDDKRCVLIDFGLAHRIDSPLTSMVHGTPRYLAPEVLRNEAAGIPADVYAMGAILYEAIAGQPPFHTLNSTGIIGMLGTESIQEIADDEPTGVNAALGDGSSIKCIGERLLLTEIASGHIPRSLQQFVAVPPAVELLVQHALVHNPSCRIQSVVELAEQIDVLLRELN